MKHWHIGYQHRADLTEHTGLKEQHKFHNAAYISLDEDQHAPCHIRILSLSKRNIVLYFIFQPGFCLVTYSSFSAFRSLHHKRGWGGIRCPYDFCVWNIQFASLILIHYTDHTYHGQLQALRVNFVRHLIHHHRVEVQSLEIIWILAMERINTIQAM